MKTLLHGIAVFFTVIGAGLVIIGGFIMAIMPYVLSIGVLGALVYVLIKLGEML